ncbi:hypothetical protein PVAP13_7NG046234 [Panicum virgatum]|uniref:Uncharacterized protein n=1 Tax=Panicum virgatum TaxID=38727 RepID=A0A8T0PTI4_PANVG|nr:hypothetical protein PVAP13_7NG046234 [Panicum virgatum]
MNESPEPSWRNKIPLRPPPPLNAVAARSKSSPRTVRRRQALEKPQDSAPQTCHGTLRTPNAHRPTPTGAGEETEPRLPTPRGEARNPAQRPTLPAREPTSRKQTQQQGQNPPPLCKSGEGTRPPKPFAEHAAVDAAIIEEELEDYCKLAPQLRRRR